MIVAEWTRKHTKDEAMTLISGVGVPPRVTASPLLGER